MSRAPQYGVRGGRTHPTRAVMSRFRFQYLAVLLAVLAAGAAPLAAQQGGEGRTYTVKRGDTLWDIARQLLGDGYLWPELFRLNTGVIADPHWIYPGAQMRVPGAAALAADSVAAPEREGTQGRSLHRPNETMTVFNPASRRQGGKSRESVLLGARKTAVRPGDFTSSPFTTDITGVEGAGSLQWSAETQGVSLTVKNRPIQYAEEVFVQLPKGATGVAGERLLVVRDGPVLDRTVRVIVPTGVLMVIAPNGSGRARVSLVQKFEDVFITQSVLPYDTLPARPGVFPSRVESGGLVTQLRWMKGEPVLPSVGQQVILTATAKDGLAAGDQVTLYRDGGVDVQGNALPEEEVAAAQITRVTPTGTSAVLLRITGPAITVGMRARVTAKMP